MEKLPNLPLCMSARWYHYTTGWSGDNIFHFDGSIGQLEESVDVIKELVTEINNEIGPEIEDRKRRYDRLSAISFD